MRSLTPKFEAILRNDVEWHRHYRDKRGARFALMLAAVRAGWNDAECRAVLLDPANPGSDLWLTGSDGRPLSDGEVHRRFTYDYGHARRVVEASPDWTAGDVTHTVQAILDRASWDGWNRRTVRTDQAVFGALCRKATQLGSLRFDISVRELGELAGKNKKTVANSVHRLVAGGRITRENGGEAWDAAEICLVAPPRGAYTIGLDDFYAAPRPAMHKLGTYTRQEMAGNCMYHSCAHPPHEVWLHLGSATQALYWGLDTDEPTPTIKQAAQQAGGISRNTASERLKTLEAYGLAHKSEDGWTRIDTDLDQLAEREGWTGDAAITAHRGNEHARDRARWNNDHKALQALTEQHQHQQGAKADLQRKAVSVHTIVATHIETTHRYDPTPGQHVCRQCGHMWSRHEYRPNANLLAEQIVA